MGRTEICLDNEDELIKLLINAHQVIRTPYIKHSLATSSAGRVVATSEGSDSFGPWAYTAMGAHSWLLLLLYYHTLAELISKC